MVAIPAGTPHNIIHSTGTMDRGAEYRAAIERWEGEGGSALTLEQRVGAPTHEAPGSERKTELVWSRVGALTP
jgi:hypothetical protein